MLYFYFFYFNAKLDYPDIYTFLGQ